MSELMRSSAGFSTDRTYRYWLSRRWDDTKPELAIIGLNPSTADETTDDPTIRRCIGYAKSWGFGQLVMLNLFAFRATDPKRMMAAPDPIGSYNDAALRSYTKHTEMVLGAWGAHGGYRHRAATVLSLLDDRPVYCLGTTKSGHPKHPLYLRADTQPAVLQTVYLP